MSKPVFSRILLKLSGEILANKDGFGINSDKVKYLAEEIKSVHDIGINSAIFEFLSEHTEWRVKKHYKNNNGLTILEKNG